MPNPLASDLDHVLDHTRGLWDELRGERIFITGGTGFFGCWLLESFIWANERLDLGAGATVLTRSPDMFHKKAPHLAGHPSVTLVQGDVRNFAFPEGAFSHVIHAATQTDTHGPSIDPLLKFALDTEGTVRALDFAQTARTRKFLFTSSGAVYGEQPADISHVPEAYSGAPDASDLNTAYGQGKHASEFLCTAYSGRFGFKTLIARCFAFVGPGLPLDANYAIGNFIRDALSDQPIRISGDGTPYRSYLYAADLAIWLWTILFKGQPCRPYNVGSENGVTISQLAQTVAHALAPHSAIQILTKPIDGQPVERYVPLTKRARTELGLREYVTLSDAIQRTARWHTLREKAQEL